MAHVDDFLRQLVAPRLVPGETILGTGLLRHPKTYTRAMGQPIPQTYYEHLGVATSRRLLVFETQIGGILSVEAKAVATNPVEWRYDEIQEVRASPANWPVAHSGGYATVFALVPHPGCGPYAAEQKPGATEGVTRRYDIYAACAGLDGQAGMSREFPFWLQSQVAAGAFPMDPARRAAIEAQRAQQWQAQAAAGAQAKAEAEARRAASAEKWRRLRPVVIPVPLGLMGLLGLALGVLVVLDDAKSAREFGELAAISAQELAVVEEDLDTWVGKAGKEPPSDCPEEEIERRERPIGKKCHGCSVDETPQRHPPLPSGWLQLERRGGWWKCPERSFYEERRATLRATHRTQEEKAGEAVFARGGAFAMVGLVLAALAVFSRVRFARAAKTA